MLCLHNGSMSPLGQYVSGCGPNHCTTKSRASGVQINDHVTLNTGVETAAPSGASIGYYAARQCYRS